MTAPNTRPRSVVTMRWDELTTAERLAVAETANALAAGGLTLDTLRAMLDNRPTPRPYTVEVFVRTVLRLLDAMHDYNAATIDDLRAEVDVAPYCEHLDTVVAERLQAVTDADTAADDAMVVGLAAQIVADAVAAQNGPNR